MRRIQREKVWALIWTSPSRHISAIKNRRRAIFLRNVLCTTAINFKATRSQLMTGSFQAVAPRTEVICLRKALTLPVLTNILKMKKPNLTHTWRTFHYFNLQCNPACNPASSYILLPNCLTTVFQSYQKYKMYILKMFVGFVVLLFFFTKTCFMS